MLTTFTSNSTSSTLTPSSFPMSDLGSLTPTPTNSSITANAAASAKARGKKSRHRSECKFCSFFRIC
ncbi:hypothetical protein BGZ73_008835 [Actinomortierella ambigua]|nr:hypothetical protein BGZ73_008835 [Actinomortierella ambigua]